MDHHALEVEATNRQMGRAWEVSLVVRQMGETCSDEGNCCVKERPLVFMTTGEVKGKGFVREGGELG